MISVDYGVLNQRGSPSWFSDVYANLPTAGYKGRMFISTDTFAFYRDTGTGWDLIGGPGTGTITGSGTSGQVSYFNGSSTLAGSNNLFWDITNSRLGIGTATPGVALDIHSTGTNAQFNGTGSSNAYLVFQNAGTSKWRIGNTYNAGANSYDIYNFGTSTTGLSINSTTNAATFIASVTATSLIKSGGTSAQFLKADGSVDSSSYITLSSLSFTAGSGNYDNTTGIITIPTNNNQITNGSGYITSSSLSSYLPLAGGTLTGALIGTSITGTSLVKSGGTSAQILAADGSVITAGTNITITGGTIAASGSGGSMAIGGSITSATAGSVLYAGASGVLAQTNASFYYDYTNNRLGLGTITIGSKLQVNGNAAIGYSASTAAPTNGLAVSGAATISNSASATYALTVTGKGTFDIGNNSTLGLFSASGITINSSGGSLTNLYQLSFGYGASATYGSSSMGAFIDSVTGYNSGGLFFATRSATTDTAPTERMRITSGGLVGIGTSSPTNKLVISGSGDQHIAQTTTTAANAYTIYTNSGKQYLAGLSRDIGPDNYIIYDGTAGAARMVITSGGLVGVGTSTIGSQFQVNGNAAIGYSASTAAPTNGLQVNGRGNFLNATDNSVFSLNSGGTLYTAGFSPNATANSTNTLTLTTAQTTWIYNGTGVATWTLYNPSGTNQMIWIKNAGTGIITLNAYTGTNIINNSGTAVSSITIAVGATALIQQDGNVKSYQLQ